MSHELRTPLNAILGYAQLLKRDPALNERQSKAARTIDDSGSHLLTLINDILDLSKIEAGKFEIYPAALDLRAFLSGIADIIRIRAEDKALAFASEVSPELPDMVMADGKRLRQVLINLLGNAVKFTDRGQVRLLVSLAALDERDARIRFSVQDTGVGISADQVASIFQPFEQVGESQRRAGGTGLGLAISRQLIELMGSEIEVKSEVGQGSCFCFALTLPLASSAPVERLPRTVVTGYRGERRKILIVDDLPGNREVLADMLTVFGFDILQAENGQEGLDKAQAERPDLVLMDSRMPVLDGFEATQRLRASPELASIPVLVLSAGAMSDERERSLSAGASGFLTKPIVEESLLSAVGEHLSLDWIHADERKSDEPAATDEPALAPPPEEVERLHVLALAGNMRAIRTHADDLAARDDRYRAFAGKLKQLAAGFQSQAILNLVEQHMPVKEGTIP
jgi:CheY-like chemotaxis protein